MSEEGLATGVAAEFVDEVLGESPRKWAVVLVALLVGVIGTLWLVRRSQGRAVEPIEEIVAEAAVA